MYKIVAAVNSMIEHPNLIERVVKGGNTYYFLYDTRFKWSITKNDLDEYRLAYYPGEQKLEELPDIDWRYSKDYVLYSTEELKTKESNESFSELYRTVQSKLYNLDSVLDQIINATL